MDQQELKKRCRRIDPLDDNGFRAIMCGFLELDETNAERLSEEFGVIGAEKTVKGWKEGINLPLPRMRLLITRIIHEWLEEEESE